MCCVLASLFSFPMSSSWWMSFFSLLPSNAPIFVFDKLSLDTRFSSLSLLQIFTCVTRHSQLVALHTHSLSQFLFSTQMVINQICQFCCLSSLAFSHSVCELTSFLSSICSLHCSAVFLLLVMMVVMVE